MARITAKGLGCTVFASLLLCCSCRWREGREVWIDRYDAAPDVFINPCGSKEDPCWIPAVDLDIAIDAGTVDIMILDIREASSCASSRIPGASCVPLVDGALVGEVDCHDDQGWIVVYDWNQESVHTAVWALPRDCSRKIHLLIDGFGAWSECEPCPVEHGDDAGPDAG